MYPATTRPAISLYLCGPFAIETSQGPLPLPAGTRSSCRHLLEALYCRRRTSPRAELGHILWYGMPESSARQNINLALTGIRKLVSTEIFQVCDTHQLHLAGQETLWVDADAIKFLIRQARAEIQKNPDQAFALFQHAHTLLERGPFLQTDRGCPWTQHSLVKSAIDAMDFLATEIFLDLVDCTLRLNQPETAAGIYLRHLTEYPSPQIALVHCLRLFLNYHYVHQAQDLFARVQAFLLQKSETPIPDFQSLSEQLQVTAGNSR